MTEPKAGYEVLTVDGYLYCIDKTKAGVELKTTKGTRFVRAKIGEIEAAAFKKDAIELIMGLDGKYCRMEYNTQGKYHNFVNAWIVEPPEEVKRSTGDKPDEPMSKEDWYEKEKRQAKLTLWVKFLDRPESIAAFSPNMDLQEIEYVVNYMLGSIFPDELSALLKSAYKKATK